MPLVGQKIETTGDNFSHRVRRGHLLVDKTMMLKEFLAGSDVSLILRPRRSGKSLNISMLQHFFAAEVAGGKTAGLFDDFAILLKTDAHKKQQLADLMQGKSIAATISLQTRYEELMEESDALWTLLLFTGYLTAVKKNRAHGKIIM
ncbi:MAG: AAA family ATPase [Gammaproteobacteria bacterium]|nr:AAA family ATPase [Gammaproteobacteria bacterium]